MRKISYRNNSEQKGMKPTTDELPMVGRSDYSTESGGRSGFRFPGEPETHDLPDEKITSPVSLIEDFVSTADELDDLDMETEANFVDFLIKKFAQVVMVEQSEEEKYIEYIYKIYNSDLPDTILKVENLSIAYSKKVSDELKSGIDKNSAKKAAFNSELLRIK